MYTLVGLPQCSTCKGIEKLLKAKAYDYTYRNITTETPSAEELMKWLKQSKETSFKKIVNTSGQKYRALNLKDVLATQTLEEQLVTIAQDGMLIKRPILLTPQGEVYWGSNVQSFVESLDSRV